MKLFFATSNSGKVKSLERRLASVGIAVEQADIPLVEPQSETVEAVARSKARQAFEALRASVVVEDSGFFIERLNGFPGVYARYVQETLGPEGLVKLMSGETNRACHFISTVAYIGGDGAMKIFSSRGSGRVAAAIDRALSADSWSDLWRIYIPDGSEKTLAAMTPAERDAHDAVRRKDSSISQFAGWIARRVAAGER